MAKHTFSKLVSAFLVAALCLVLVAAAHHTHHAFGHASRPHAHAPALQTGGGAAPCPACALARSFTSQARERAALVAPDLATRHAPQPPHAYADALAPRPRSSRAPPRAV